MKNLLLTMLAFIFAAMAPISFADSDDSALGKAAKAKVYTDADDDSALKKGATLKKTGDILSDEGDSAATKAVKLKALDSLSDQ